MSTTILTDEQIRDLFRFAPQEDYTKAGWVGRQRIAIGRAIEQAVLQSPEVQGLREAQAWRPIETAPRDGTDILLSNGVSVAEGHWFHEEGYIREHRDLDGRYIGQDESDGFDGWIDWDGGMTTGPTHWMPLPPPPNR